MFHSHFDNSLPFFNNSLGQNIIEAQHTLPSVRRQAGGMDYTCCFLKSNRLLYSNLKNGARKYRK